MPAERNITASMLYCNLYIILYIYHSNVSPYYVQTKPVASTYNTLFISFFINSYTNVFCCLLNQGIQCVSFVLLVLLFRNPHCFLVSDFTCKSAISMKTERWMSRVKCEAPLGPRLVVTHPTQPHPNFK